MKKSIFLALSLSATAAAADLPTYRMDYATIERGSTGIRGDLYYFTINERHLMPATCLRGNKVHIDASIPTSGIAYALIYEASLIGTPADFLSWEVREDGDCYLKNLKMRDVSGAQSYLLSRLYLHNTLNDEGQFWAEGCPNPFEPVAIIAYEYQTRTPGEGWSQTYGGHMGQMVGTTCESQAPLGILATPGDEIRWRATADGHKTDWVNVVRY